MLNRRLLVVMHRVPFAIDKDMGSLSRLGRIRHDQSSKVSAGVIFLVLGPRVPVQNILAHTREGSYSDSIVSGNLGADTSAGPTALGSEAL